MSWEHWNRYYYFICPICGKNVNMVEHVAEDDFCNTECSYTYEKCSCGFDFKKEMKLYFSNMSDEEYKHHKHNSLLREFHVGTSWEEYKQIYYCKYKNIEIKRKEGV